MFFICSLGVFGACVLLLFWLCVFLLCWCWGFFFGLSWLFVFCFVIGFLVFFLNWMRCVFWSFGLVGSGVCFVVWHRGLLCCWSSRSVVWLVIGSCVLLVFRSVGGFVSGVRGFLCFVFVGKVCLLASVRLLGVWSCWRWGTSLDSTSRLWH